MQNSEISFLVVIADKKQKDDLLNELPKVGAKFCNIVYGKGLVKQNQVLAAFGLVYEPVKVIIYSFIKKENTNEIFDMLVEKFNFNKPNTGIAYTIPVDKLKYQ